MRHIKLLSINTILLNLLSISCSDYAIDKLVPDIDVEPDEIVFTEVPITTALANRITVSNVGDGNLSIYEIYLKEESDAFSIKAIAGILPQDGISVMTVVFSPMTEGEVDNALIITSNDPDEPEVEIPITGKAVAAPAPDIFVIPENLSFGEVSPGNTAILDVTIVNEGNATLSIESVLLDGSPDFSLTTTDPTGEKVAPTASTLMRVSYTPDSTESDEGEVRIYSNDPDENPVTVTLSGNLTGNIPPVADAGPDQSAAPLDTVMLDGSGSYDPDGDYPLSYSWYFKSRPSGSTATITGSTQARPSVYLDIAGDYELGLIVTDSLGLSSAEDSMKIEVVPWQDLHIQIVWTTDHTDIDLHLIREGGAFFDSPSDCCYCNMAPEWGSAGTSDNPSLDIDDINGYGPENINIIDPYDGLYTIFVHYYGEDGAFGVGGSTSVTLRVYISGSLAAEYNQNLSNSRLVWEVCTVDWPSGTISTLGSVYPSSLSSCF